MHKLLRSLEDHKTAESAVPRILSATISPPTNSLVFGLTFKIFSESVRSEVPVSLSEFYKYYKFEIFASNMIN